MSLKNQDTINERLKFLIDKLGMSVRGFSTSLGVSDTNTRNYIDRGSKPNSEYLEKLLRRFNDINPAWLLLGEGEPFLPESGRVNEHFINYQKNVSGIAQTGSNSTATQHNYSIAECEKERDIYKAKLEVAETELGGLRQQLQMARDLIASKDDTIALLRDKTQ